MATYDGTYNSILKGVSQQIPQEREDGQLGSQLNMLSDPVTGLRRRGGIKHHADLTGVGNDPYIKLVDILGVNYLMFINNATGTVRIYSMSGTLLRTYQTPYLICDSKRNIRSIVSRNNCYIVNTEQVPTKQSLTTSSTFNPAHAGYLSVRQGAFSKQYSVTIKWSTFNKSFSFQSTSSTASQATPTFLALQFHSLMSADADITAAFDLAVDGMTVAMKAKGTPTWSQLTVETGDGDVWIMTSGSSRVAQRTQLLGILPDLLDGYVMAVGTLKNSSYYQYSKDTNTWKEVGKWENDYSFINEPIYWTYDSSQSEPFIFKELGIKMRGAGDEENNPLPKFVGFGITGIGTYQSRLILLSGSYVCASATKDYSQFMRTTVTELLDDDPIEISSASLSSAQFEYAVPYNKDLVLISNTHQAVIPSNNTVMTPRSAVIYPSAEVDISLAAEPSVVSRSLFYTYQRGSEYFQVGEFIPNSYTDAQYYSQGLTDHIPLYAKGVCTGIASSPTNNTVVFCSGINEMLICQYLWQGDQRVLLSFHKWTAPYEVLHAVFDRETLYLFMRTTLNNVVVGTINLQLNQLDDKPTPYLDLYRYVTITDGTGTVNFDTTDHVASVYSQVTMRHQESIYSVDGTTIRCPYDGVIAMGLRYTSEFSITPPFIKDQNGKVLAGVKSTVQSFRFTFKSTSTFHANVSDTMGVSYDYTKDTALTWSEADIGVATINNVGSVTIPCRTQMASTKCSISTDSTTDMNVVSVEYVIRYQGKHRRL